MQLTEVGGTTYAVLAAAGSSTLSVMEVGTDGSLTLRDHVLDGLTSRFGGVTSLEVVTHQGHTYVIAGGADDGISVFVLLEGGQLMARAHIADSNDMSLDNVSAIAVQGCGNGLDIYVASSSETGVTQLRFDAGTPGVTNTAAIGGGLLSDTSGNDILQGLVGNDQITAGNGDDILRDGDGSDTLTGGAGADVFVLSRDGLADTITDFTLGEDKLDLSLWPMLRDISQLAFSIQSYGMDVIYGDELLVVRSADGNYIDYRLLDNDSVIGAGTRISTMIEPGYPGPATPTPDPNAQPTAPSADDAGTVGSMTDSIAVMADHGFSTLRSAISCGGGTVPAAARVLGTDNVVTGTYGNDAIYGTDTIDILLAGAGNDIVRGGGGDDILLGRAGNDDLSGDAGGDLLIGGSGEDHLQGGSGQDVLHGGADDDVLEGDLGDDILFGEAGADTFIFNGGTDVISDYEQGLDDITLDASIWTGLLSAEDVLTVYGSIEEDRATIDLGDGNVLQVIGVADFATFAADIAIF
jgi:Ca2+-binding RTX toxin-like protein